MLLRQLVRHPLRSVTPKWRPVNTVSALSQHGNSRANYSDNSSRDNASRDDPSRDATSSDLASSDTAISTNDSHLYNEEEQRQAPQSLATSGQSPSLFERLFPDEAKEAKAKLRRASATDVPKNAWPFEEGPSSPPVLDSVQDEDSPTNELSEEFTTAFQAKSMLVLSAASKTLLESDFLRLGVKGKHLDGWIGGILKVIQARDPDTLEPKGHYFILFDTHEAAVVYKERLEYLWQLGKTYVPGAHHAHSHMIQSPLPTGLRQTEQGEDIAELIRSFTLVPPSQRHHIQLSLMNPSKIAELYLEGGFVQKLTTRDGSRFHVLIRMEGGQLALKTLRQVIKEDGKQRNLPWRITDLENGILPFGKSVLKGQDKDDELAQKVAKKSSAHDAQAQGSRNVAGNPKKVVDNTIYENKRSNQRWYPRFLVPFMDQAEAYRFVRSWHRRELRLQMGSGKKKNQPAWEEVRIINATVLW